MAVRYHIQPGQQESSSAFRGQGRKCQATAGFAMIAIDDIHSWTDSSVDEIARVMSENRVGEWSRQLLGGNKEDSQGSAPPGQPAES